MGFSSEAAIEFGLGDNSFIRVGINTEDENDNSLYLLVLRDSSGDAFKVRRAGDYFYLNTKQFFNDLGVDYLKDKIIYDVGKLDYEGTQIYKLIRRTVKPRKKDD